MGFELGILDGIQHLRNPVMDSVMVFITHLGDGGAVWIALALVLLLIPKTRRCGAVLAASLMLEVVCCNLLLKPLTARVRPCDVSRGIALLVPRPEDYSFPSGHTGASFAAVLPPSAPFFPPLRISSLLCAFPGAPLLPSVCIHPSV